jgi:hypothetical protein
MLLQRLSSNGGFMRKDILTICLLAILAFTCSNLSAQSITEHIIAPQATDPSIDQALDDHYAWIDTTVASNRRLLVYLPGTGGVPGNALLAQQEAAKLGYHVIGLMYVTSYSLSQLCTSAPDPNSCFENAHYEITFGIDVSPLVDVNQTNSIENRLTKLLQYLVVNYPDEGWASFLADGKPQWSQIAFSGFSQGGGNAAMIAKYHVVSRVVFFSAVADALGATNCRGAHTWEATHATPSDRYWGLAHDQDPFFINICASWDDLGMSIFGPLVQVETSSSPYGFTHMLFTDLKPQREGYKSAHPSTVIDIYTPLDEDHNPALAPAWRYMMSAPINEGD